MKAAAATLTIACVMLTLPAVVAAKGGHGGGGHSSGSHSSGSHGSGGHRTGGGSSSGSSSTGGASHRTTAPPTHVRPGTGQPSTGTAVPRPVTTPIPSFTNGSTLLPSRPLFGTVGFGFGAYPWWLFGAGAFGAQAPPDEGDVTGGLRLDVEPTSAQVFVDGYYVGTVGDFNSRFQHLDLDAGPHHLEIRSEGYEPIAVNLIIQPRRTLSYRGTLAPAAR